MHDGLIFLIHPTCMHAYAFIQGLLHSEKFAKLIGFVHEH
jgi:hypothetical protein